MWVWRMYLKMFTPHLMFEVTSCWEMEMVSLKSFETGFSGKKLGNQWGFSIWKHWILRHTQTMVIFAPENKWLEPPQTALSIWVLECQAGSQKSCSDRSSCFARVWNKSQKEMKIIKFRGLFFVLHKKFLQSPDGVCSKTSWGTGLVAAKTLARKGDFNRWSRGGWTFHRLAASIV